MAKNEATLGRGQQEELGFNQTCPSGEVLRPAEDDLSRANNLRELMYSLSEESLNLAHHEEEPAKRNALMQAGMTAANGWIRMSDLRDKLQAIKAKASEK